MHTGTACVAAVILAMGLIPAYSYRRDQRILPRGEEILVAVYFIVFLVFCSASQYSRFQFNFGFRQVVARKDAQGPLKNKFAELVLRFAPDLARTDNN